MHLYLTYTLKYILNIIYIMTTNITAFRCVLPPNTARRTPEEQQAYDCSVAAQCFIQQQDYNADARVYNNIENQRFVNDLAEWNADTAAINRWHTEYNRQRNAYIVAHRRTSECCAINGSRPRYDCTNDSVCQIGGWGTDMRIEPGAQHFASNTCNGPNGRPRRTWCVFTEQAATRLALAAMARTTFGASPPVRKRVHTKPRREQYGMREQSTGELNINCCTNILSIPPNTSARDIAQQCTQSITNTTNILKSAPLMPDNNETPNNETPNNEHDILNILFYDKLIYIMLLLILLILSSCGSSMLSM